MQIGYWVCDYNTVKILNPPSRYPLSTPEKCCQIPTSNQILGYSIYENQNWSLPTSIYPLPVCTSTRSSHLPKTFTPNEDARICGYRPCEWSEEPTVNNWLQDNLSSRSHCLSINDSNSHCYKFHGSRILRCCFSCQASENPPINFETTEDEDQWSNSLVWGQPISYKLDQQWNPNGTIQAYWYSTFCYPGMESSTWYRDAIYPRDHQLHWCTHQTTWMGATYPARPEDDGPLLVVRYLRILSL